MSDLRDAECEPQTLSQAYLLRRALMRAVAGKL